MTVFETGAVSATNSQQEPIANGEHSSMSRQDSWDNHGHDMHPQQFVRLIGCHGANAACQQAAHSRLVQQ